MKYSKQQIYLLSSAGLYLLGAIFMLVNAFADAVWAFWIGLVFAIGATALYILMAYFDKVQNKIEHGKQSTITPAPNAPEPVTPTSDGGAKEGSPASDASGSPRKSTKSPESQGQVSSPKVSVSKSPKK